jgi:outer membrane murein-binding lipoprotein Lpp
VSARDRALLAIIAIGGLLAGAWMLLIKPEHAKAQTLATQVSTLQSQLSTAQSQVSSGLAARAQFASAYSELARLGEALPTDDQVPSLIYQIQSAASASKVDFRTLQMASSSAPAPAASSSTPAPAASSGSAASSTSSSTPSSSAATIPPGATTGPAGLPMEQFTFEFTGSFFHLSGFFKRLQQFVIANNKHISVSGRLLTINAISLAAGPTGFPQVSANVSATTYMAPAAQSVLNSATPAGPGGATSSTGKPTGTPTPAAATISSPN